MQIHACEKSGRILDFHTYLTEEAVFLRDSSIPFRGNRCNVLFFNGGILYYVQDHLQHFFDIVKVHNKLLRSVNSDVPIQSYLCRCRALGLINKFVTGPLGRLLLNLLVDASEFMLDSAIYFEKVKISKDNVHNSLAMTSNFLDEPKK